MSSLIQSTYKEIIRQYAKPGFLAHGELEKSTFKTDPAYYLTISENQKQEDCPYFKSQYEASLPPIEITNDPRQFWVWVWEVYFEDEDYHIDNLHNYEEEHSLRGKPFEAPPIGLKK